MQRKELRQKYNLTKEEYKEALRSCSIPDKQKLTKAELKLFEEYMQKVARKKPKSFDVTHTEHLKQLFSEVKAKYPYLHNDVIKDVVSIHNNILKSYIKEGKSYRILGLFSIQKPRKRAGESIKAFGKEFTLKRHITTMKLSKKAREAQ